MTSPLTFAVTLALIIVLGLLARRLEEFEREERLTEETLEATKLLDESLKKRLDEINDYRHDLLELVRKLDREELQEAERRAIEGRAHEG